MIRRSALLVTCVVLVAAVPANAFDLNLAVGADFGGDFDLGDVSLSSDTGYTLGLEIAFEVPFIELGAGLEYGFRAAQAVPTSTPATTRSTRSVGSSSGRSTLQAASDTPNMSVSTIFDGDFGGGGTWGLGGGVELFGKLKAELLLQQHQHRPQVHQLDDPTALHVLEGFACPTLVFEPPRHQVHQVRTEDFLGFRCSH